MTYKTKDINTRSMGMFENIAGPILVGLEIYLSRYLKLLT